MKIQWKIVYIKCTNSPDLLRNLFSLKVQNHENSMENCVYQMYRLFRFVKKFEFVECTNSGKIDGKSINVPNREGVHKMYRQSGLVEKFDFVESTKS